MIKKFLKKSKYDKDKQGLDKKGEDVQNKIADVSRSVTNTACNIKIGKVQKKVPDINRLFTYTAFYTKIGQVEKILDNAKYTTNECKNFLKK